MVVSLRPSLMRMIKRCLVRKTPHVQDQPKRLVAPAKVKNTWNVWRVTVEVTNAFTGVKKEQKWLARVVKKTQEILDENNYSQEDTFLVLRVFLHKTKKILNLIENIDKETNIEKVIADYKPPIFWKDKPIIKKQLQLWSFKTINELIYKLNDIELKVKKNNTTSLILMKNFIYEVAASN